MTKFTSDFALLDVKHGRDDLNIRVDEKSEKIPVLILGTIDDVWSGDDGVSREFSVSVIRVRELSVEERDAMSAIMKQGAF